MGIEHNPEKIINQTELDMGGEVLDMEHLESGAMIISRRLFTNLEGETFPDRPTNLLDDSVSLERVGLETIAQEESDL